MTLFESLKERLGLGKQARLDAGEPTPVYAQNEIDAVEALYDEAARRLWEYDAFLERRIAQERAKATPDQNRLIILEYRRELIDHEDLRLSYALSEMDAEDMELCRARYQALVEDASSSAA